MKRFTKKGLHHICSLGIFFDILQNSYSVEHLWKAASDLFHEFWFIKFREIKQCSIKLKHLVRLFGSNFCDKNSNSDHFIFILETKIHGIFNCSLRIYASYTYIRIPPTMCLFKVNNRNSRKRCRICSKLTL